MSIRVAINGFGRIGRLTFRQLIVDPEVEVVAINDLTSPRVLAHLLKYDTTQGGFGGRMGENLHGITYGDDYIEVDGKRITIYAIPDAQNLPWGRLDIDVVVESTGRYTKKAQASAHLLAGAKGVVIGAPSDKDVPTIVYSVNHETLTKEDKIISAASCTTNCLAPMAKALNDAYRVVSGIMLTVHAYTPDQMALDAAHRNGDLRRSRASAQNIVPNSTGAAKAIGLVIPELNGKLIGSAQRVPVPTGSTTILSAVIKVPEAELAPERINQIMKEAASESFGYCDEEIVSSDIVGMTYGSLFDATQTLVARVSEHTFQVQVVSWYDNENSYVSQMVRTLKHFAGLKK